MDSNAETFAFETLSPIHRVAVSKAFLCVVDADNRGFLCNMDTGVVVHRFHVSAGTDLNAVCRNVEFSRDGLYLAISIGRKVQVWRLPETRCKIFSPMVLEHEFAQHARDVVCLDWAPSDFGFITGSMDSTAHLQLFQRKRRDDKSEWNFPAHHLSVSLVGHKTAVVGCYYMDRPMEDPCIFTVSEDGSMFEWRYMARKTEEGKDLASRKHRTKRKRGENKHDVEERDWILQQRHFIQQAEVATVTCTASNNQSFILFGFSNGVFALHELPTGQKLQSLSVSKFALESAAITNDGAWLALASPTLGQLVVWEWMSETFVLKQQGHFFNMNALAHSPDGRSVATGADDGKVKVWSASTNTCFVTFTEHTGPISAITFASNSCFLSSSLDGTVRAFDLIRLRNFRTMTPPEPCQLTCLAVSGGEVVCAGAMEPPNIFMWSLRTGKLLEVMSGHTGPISSLDFSSTSAMLASCSWDGSIKLWEPFRDTSAPTLTLTSTESNSAPSGQLCVTFRPDGKELCSCGLDGNIVFWNVESGAQTGTIECKRDLGLRDGKVTSFFNSVCYSADGRIVFAGGKSSWVFAYDCERELLLKKYQLAHRVMSHGEEGTEDEHGDDARKRRFRDGKALPGTIRGRDAGKRELLDPEITVSCIRFSPTGRSWSVSTNQGMLTFSLDANAAFDPVNVDEDCTPQSAREACRRGDFAVGLNQALFLGEETLVRELLASVPLDSMSLVARSVPKSQVSKCMSFIAGSLESSVAVEYNIRWALSLFAAISEADAQKFRQTLLPALRSLQKAVSRQEQMLAKLCDDNMYDLQFLLESSTQE